MVSGSKGSSEGAKFWWRRLSFVGKERQGTVVREGFENERDGGIVFAVGGCAFALGGVLCEEGVAGLWMC